MLRAQLFLQVGFKDEGIKELFNEFLFVWWQLFYFSLPAESPQPSAVLGQGLCEKER
jgi:hypothetical protein